MRLDDLGKLILRLTVAGLLLFHGIPKIEQGIGFVHQMVEASGLPPFVAYGVYVGEIVAPVLVIAGFFTRPAALIIAMDMAGAVYMARRDDVFSLGQGGMSWAIEVEAFFFFGALAVACLGAGRIALGKGRWD